MSFQDGFQLLQGDCPSHSIHFIPCNFSNSIRGNNLQSNGVGYVKTVHGVPHSSSTRPRLFYLTAQTMVLELTQELWDLWVSWCFIWSSHREKMYWVGGTKGIAVHRFHSIYWWGRKIEKLWIIFLAPEEEFCRSLLPLAIVTWFCLSFLWFLKMFFGDRVDSNFKVWKQEERLSFLKVKLQEN